MAKSDENDFYDDRQQVYDPGRVKKVQKSLRLAFHPGTGEHERAAALKVVTTLDPTRVFIEHLDVKAAVKLPEYHPTRVWRQRLDEKDAIITQRDATIRTLRKQLKRPTQTIEQLRDQLRQAKKPIQPEQPVVSDDSESKVLPFPLLHTNVLYFQLADRKWAYPKLGRGGQPDSIGWINVKRYVLEYLWQTGHITTIEQLFAFFTNMVEGDKTDGKSPQNYIPKVGPKGVTLKNANGRNVGSEVQRALKHFGVPFEIVVYWDDVQNPKSHGSAQGRHSQVAAFPGMIARLTNTETADLISCAADDLIGNYPNFTLLKDQTEGPPPIKAKAVSDSGNLVGEKEAKIAATEWTASMAKLIREVAARQEYFTLFDVLAREGKESRNIVSRASRATRFGNLMTAAIREGVCERTDRQISRKSNHGRAVPVWRSLIWSGAAS